MNASERKSQAGAVHAMWLVSIMILWLGTLALLYVTNSEIATFQAAASDSETRRKSADTKWQEQFDKHKALSDVVGYTDAADLQSRSNVAALRIDLDAAKGAAGNALGGPDSSVTVDQAVKALVSSHQAAVTAKKAAESALESERAARASADRRVGELETQYKTQITQLRQDLSDEQQRGATQAGNSDRQLADLRRQQQDADDTARTVQRELEDAQVAAARKASTAEATIRSLAVKRAPREPDAPDGQILSVSADGTLAWIDIGSRNTLRPGTRFEVLRKGKGGQLVSRGTVEVREVEHDMASVGLQGKADVFDPMLPGDLVRNPHFNRNESLHFFLLGEFPLGLSKEFVSSRLLELGAVVDGSVGTGTDVLVLGSKNLADGEFAVELEETDEYRLADRLGMRIMRLADLSGYLSF